MILSAQSIRSRIQIAFKADIQPLIRPFCERNEIYKNGWPRLTFGLSPAGYDIRISQETIIPAKGFKLASSLEEFCLPNDILARITDKSTWARLGLAVQNTVAEPGWRGFLTLELTNHGTGDLCIFEGAPIAQILFELLDQPTDQPYQGKYQDQTKGPVPAF